MGLRKVLRIALTTDSTMAPRKAGRNPSTVNPGTSQAARPSIAAFMTNAKIPKVRIVIGKEIKWTIGFIKAFTRPITREARINVVAPSTSMPETRRTVM